MSYSISWSWFDWVFVILYPEIAFRRLESNQLHIVEFLKLKNINIDWKNNNINQIAFQYKSWSLV